MVSEENNFTTSLTQSINPLINEVGPASVKFSQSRDHRWDTPFVWQKLESNLGSQM